MPPSQPVRANRLLGSSPPAKKAPRPDACAPLQSIARWLPLRCSPPDLPDSTEPPRFLLGFSSRVGATPSPELSSIPGCFTRKASYESVGCCSIVNAQRTPWCPAQRGCQATLLRQELAEPRGMGRIESCLGPGASSVSEVVGDKEAAAVLCLRGMTLLDHSLRPVAVRPSAVNCRRRSARSGPARRREWPRTPRRFGRGRRRCPVPLGLRWSPCPDAAPGPRTQARWHAQSRAAPI